MGSCWRAEERYPVNPNFRWVTQDGTIMRPRDMHTSHLYNALRMIWNHSVPRAFAVLPFNHQYKINIPRPERRLAIANLFSELMNRNDLTEGMKNGLRKMAEYVNMMAMKKYQKVI